jgi:hypothetical protein
MNDSCDAITQSDPEGEIRRRRLTYQRVSSSCIAEVSYDLTDEILAVRFHNGREYWYARIPPETHQALLAAASIGRYFNAKVRDAYPHHRTR